LFADLGLIADNATKAKIAEQEETNKAYRQELEQIRQFIATTVSSAATMFSNKSE
jgi:hypothetical protein